MLLLSLNFESYYIILYTRIFWKRVKYGVSFLPILRHDRIDAFNTTIDYCLLAHISSSKLPFEESRRYISILIYIAHQKEAFRSSYEDCDALKAIVPYFLIDCFAKF